MPGTAHKKVPIWYSQAKKDRFILGQLVSKDFKLKYRRSVLGILWSLLVPLGMSAVLAIVFSQLVRGDPDINCFPVYIILGNTCWSCMQESTDRGMMSIIESAPLLKKIRINRCLFPLQRVMSAFVNYGLAMIAALAVILFFGLGVSAQAIWLPVYVVEYACFCAGLSFLLSALVVFFRDIGHLWGVLLLAWTYCTPLFYPIGMLPEWMQHAEVFNPMYLFVTFIRRCLMWQVFPGWDLILGCGAVGAGTLALGYLVFHRLEHKFILYI